MLPNKLILSQHQCPGDILMLTAAVRDLKTTFPDICIDIRTKYPYLWENNPYISKITEQDVRIYPIGYKAPHQLPNNPDREHFIYAFHRSLEQLFDIKLNRGANFPDIWLNGEDKIPIIDSKKPLLLINAGSKADFPIKQWPPGYFQEIADICSEKYTVVQIGETINAKHKPLKGVINMLNKTPGREIIRLMYQADAVVTGVSFPMHLWAGVNYADQGARKCVVLAGNREDYFWERYPGADYLSAGCKWVDLEAGCWKKYLPPKFSDPTAVCTNPIRLSDSHYYARCVGEIPPENVVKCLM